MKFHINSGKRDKAIGELKELQQKNKVKTIIEEDVMLIKKDRER